MGASKSENLLEKRGAEKLYVIKSLSHIRVAKKKKKKRSGMRNILSPRLVEISSKKVAKSPLPSF
jgi:hypothetical protein